MTIDEQKDFLQQHDNKSLVDKPCLGFSWGVSNFLTDIYIDNKPIVYEIDIDGPAFKKIDKGDLIVEINSIKINSIRQFIVQVDKLKPNQTVYLKVKRKKKFLSYAINTISFKQKYEQKIKMVWFGIELYSPNGKPKILNVERSLLSYNKLKNEDRIISINKKKIHSVDDFDIERKKLSWSSKVILEVIRNGGKKNITITLPKYDETRILKPLQPRIGVFEKKNNVIVNNVKNNMFDGKKVADMQSGDIIIEFNKKKIKSLKDWFCHLSSKDYLDEIDLKIKRQNKYLNIKFQLRNFADFVNSIKNIFLPLLRNSQKRWEYFYNEWKMSNFEIFPYNQIKRINLMKFDERTFEEIAFEEDFDPEEYNYIDKDYVYKDDETNLETTIKKTKIKGLDTFLITIKNLPDTTTQQIIQNNKGKIYIKIMVYDVTDLNLDKYNKENNGDKYINKNCNPIKTKDQSWSFGEDVLIQNKELEGIDKSIQLAIPFSAMIFPKYGKRKLTFRTYVCNDLQKFDLASGRILNNEEEISYDEDRLFLFNDASEFDFKNYPNLISYHAVNIDAFYKQPGYLEYKARESIDLIISLYFCFEKENNKKNLLLNKIKEHINFETILSEENIYRTLGLKKNYNLLTSKNFNPIQIAEELKKNLIIEERYDLLEKLLNFAIKDEVFTRYENDLIDNVAKIFEVKNDRYNELKRSITASIKFEDFDKTSYETIFGINERMTNSEKIKILRKEYSRWNALTNNTDKSIRDRAREMRDLAAKLRTELSN